MAAAASDGPFSQLFRSFVSTGSHQRVVDQYENTHLLVLGVLFAALAAYAVGANAVASAVGVDYHYDVSTIIINRSSVLRPPLQNFNLWRVVGDMS
eukprot:3774938-Pyramimonas_sp.AAC.1